MRPKITSTIAAAALVAAGLVSANAQTTAYTDPVGYDSEDCPGGSDTRISVPFTQKPAFVGQATAVSGTTLTHGGSVTLTGSNYVLFTSGSGAGKWFDVSASTASSVTGVNIE